MIVDLLYSICGRIAADLELNLQPALPMLPSIGQGFKSVSFQPGDDLSSPSDAPVVGKTQLNRFSRALRAIEKERLKTRSLIMVMPRYALQRQNVSCNVVVDVTV